MKVSGPPQPPAPDVSGPEGRGTRESTSATKAAPEPGKSFADKVIAPKSAEKTAGIAKAGGLERTSNAAVRPLVSDVASDLQTGKLTARAAIDKVLDRVVARQIGPEAPAAIRDQVRAALEDAVENDPLLAGKLQQLDTGT